MSERTVTDGKPFYCTLCGCGFGEYLACEMPDCELESEADAQKRKAAKQLARQKKDARQRRK